MNRDVALLERGLPRAQKAERWIDHEPTDKQRAFLSLTCLEALYGGAAGGGKTDALLMAAAQYVGVPGYAALLLRRTYADLAKDGAIMDRAKSWWIPKGVEWSEKDKRFTFPSGATIAFGYLDNANDKYNYQGGEWQFIGFDELTQFPADWYTYLFSRLRRLRNAKVPLRVRSASNPGGIGHDWVHTRFLLEPGVQGRAFVPASLGDNPHLDRASYAESLARLDPTTRRQLAEGIWVRDGSGLVYGHFDEARNLRQEPRELGYHLIGLDFGIVDENAVSVLGWSDHDATVDVVECYRIKANVTDMCAEVQKLYDRYNPVQVVGDTGGMGKAFAEELTTRYGLPCDPAEKQNKLGYISLLNAALADGKLRIDPKRCAHLLEEWKSLPWNETRLKEADGFKNHASDATLYAWRAACAYSETPEEKAPVYGTPEFYQAQERALLARMEERQVARLREESW